MAQYTFKDAKLENGFFSKLKSDKITDKVTLVRTYNTERGKQDKVTQMTGNMLPNIERLKRAKWDDSKHRWMINATEKQLQEWAHNLGAVDKDNRFIERVSLSNPRDPFITSIKIKIGSDYILDDATPLGQLHKAVLQGRHDIDWGNENINISEYDKRYNLEYAAVKLGERVEDEEVVDVDDMMHFMSTLNATTLEKKVMIAEAIGINVPQYPEEKIINSSLYKKWSDEGNKKVGYSLQSVETNKSKIDRLLNATSGELEMEYIISKAMINKIILWLPNFKYYEYNGINVGRKPGDVEEYFRDDKNSDMFQKLAKEIKEQEAKIKKGVKRDTAKS